ncbi:MAG TPA: glycogen/starch synthase [Anaerolineales bacterium]
MSATINILFLAAEAEPFIKIGGLADVAGSLPLALRLLPYQATRGVTLDVRLVLPLHHTIRAMVTTLLPVAEFSVYRRGGNIPVQVFEMSSGGMPVYFINGDPLSNTPSVYSTDPALDREKYAFFSLAALELTRHLDWHPDIVHANDWHTALALYALRSRPTDPLLARLRTVFTVHNLPYMGGDGSDVLSAYGLLPLTDDSLPKWAQTQPLPLGLWSADAIIPVSPTYAREILTPDFGCGLDPYLKTRTNSMTGILNGLDVNNWNPETDKALAARFTADELPARAANKTALKKTLELKEDGRVPLLVMIGRIDQQKGLDITFEALRQMADRNWQFVILGSGDPALENAARNLQADFPDRARTVIRYDAALSRLLYGGADMFLMPSRYEPCGLAQMIAMRYGCVPVVRATGGLKDTVQEGKTGFLFQEAKAGSMVEALERALTVYDRPEMWQHFQRNGMKKDFSWPRAARQYAIIYRSLISGS